MILAARQLAWLGSRPKDADGKPAEHSRAEQIKADGGIAQLPELDAPYLLAYLQELGMCSQGGMGAAPLSSTELLAWLQGMGLALAPWEFRALRAASSAYVVELNAESDQPPYGDTDDMADPDVIDEKLSRMLDRLATPLDKRAK